MNSNRSKRNKAISIAIFIVVSAFMVSSLPAVAQGQVTVSIDDITAEEGGSITEPIMLNGITNYGTGTINVAYNAAVVHVTDVTSGPDSDVAAWDADNIAGLVSISAWNLDGVSGDIIFANVEYTAVGSVDDTSPLNIDILTLYDISYEEIPATPDDGSFTIETGPTPAAVPLLGLPAIIALAGIMGILAITVIIKKKTKK